MHGMQNFATIFSTNRYIVLLMVYVYGVRGYEITKIIFNEKSITKEFLNYANLLQISFPEGVK